MSKTYEVIIKRNNGHYRAALAHLPDVVVEAPTRNEALRQLRQATTEYLQQVELATIEVELPRQDSLAGMQLVREDVNGYIQEYYPIGKYVVVQPLVCGGRPTIKYTRIDARALTGGLRRGDSAELLAEMYGIPLEAVHEAVRLADVYDYDRSYA